MLLPKPEVSMELSEREAMPTRELLGSDNLRHRTELHWRLSLPLLVFVVTVLAVPLARSIRGRGASSSCCRPSFCT